MDIKNCCSLNLRYLGGRSFFVSFTSSSSSTNKTRKKNGSRICILRDCGIVPSNSINVNSKEQEKYTVYSRNGKRRKNLRPSRGKLPFPIFLSLFLSLLLLFLHPLLLLPFPEIRHGVEVSEETMRLLSIPRRSHQGNDFYYKTAF